MRTSKARREWHFHLRPPPNMQALSQGPFKENSIFFTLWTTVSLRSDSLTMRHFSPWRPSRLYAFWLLSEEDLGYFCYASEAVTHLSFTLAWLQVLWNPFFLLSALPFFEPFGMYCPLTIDQIHRKRKSIPHCCWVVGLIQKGILRISCYCV